MSTRYNVSDYEWREILHIRSELHRRGYICIPANENQKSPMFKGWQQYNYDPSNPEPVIPRTTNAKGEPTKMPHLGTSVSTIGICAVDIDINDPIIAKRVRVAFERVAGKSPVVRYRKGVGRLMLIYKAHRKLERTTWSEAGPRAAEGAEAPKLEVDANHPGQQAYLYGMHPSGEPLRYEQRAPHEVSIHELPELDHRALAEAYKAGVEAMGGTATEAVTGEKRGRSYHGDYRDLGSKIVALLDGEGGTSAASEIYRILLNDDVPLHIADAIVWAVATEGRRRHPNETTRWEYLFRQLVHQKPTMGARFAALREEYTSKQMSGEADVEQMQRALDKQSEDRAAQIKRLRSLERQVIAGRILMLAEALPVEDLDHMIRAVRKMKGERNG